MTWSFFKGMYTSFYKEHVKHLNLSFEKSIEERKKWVKKRKREGKKVVKEKKSFTNI